MTTRYPTYTLYATVEGSFVVAPSLSEPEPGYTVRRYETRAGAERARERLAEAYEIAGRPTIVARHPLGGLVATRCFQTMAAWILDMGHTGAEVAAALFAPEGGVTVVAVGEGREAARAMIGREAGQSGHNGIAFDATWHGVPSAVAAEVVRTVPHSYIPGAQ